MRTAEAPLGGTRLSKAVARNYFKLLAYKDEYEVGRLYSDPAFWDKVDATFEGDFSIRFHLAAPLLARPDPTPATSPKRTFGPGVRRIFSLLARLKRLRRPLGHLQADRGTACRAGADRPVRAGHGRTDHYTSPSTGWTWRSASPAFPNGSAATAVVKLASIEGGTGAR